MIKLLQILFFGHSHKWEIEDVRRLEKNHDFGLKSTGSRYVLRCDVCGTIKKKDIV